MSARQKFSITHDSFISWPSINSCIEVSSCNLLSLNSCIAMDCFTVNKFFGFLLFFGFSLVPISGSDLVAWKHQVYRQIGSNPILMRCIRSFQ